VASRHRFLLGLVWLAPVLAGLACADRDEARKRQLIQSQVAVVDTQIKALDAGRVELDHRMRLLRRDLESLDRELARSAPRLQAAARANSYLSQLTTYGFGEGPGRWLLTHPAFTTPGWLFLSLFLLAIWLLWRLYQRDLEQRMNAEIDLVIRRLATAAAPASASTPTPAPRHPAPEPAPHRGARAGRESRPAPPAPEPAAYAPPPPKSPRPETPGHQTAPETGAAPEKKAAAAKEKKTDAAAPPPAAAPAKAAAGPAPKAAGGAAPKTAEAAARAGAVRKAGAAGAAKREPRKKAAPKTKGCKVKGCPSKHRSKGFCNKHYQQWRRGLLTEEVEEE